MSESVSSKRRAARRVDSRPVEVATVGAPELPEDYWMTASGGEAMAVPFLDLTRRHWEALWKSPLAAGWGPELEPMLFQWAVHTDRFNRGSLTRPSAELRKIERELMVTPQQWHRNKLIAAVPDEPKDVGVDPEKVARLDRMRDRAKKEG